jgi:hypothetical protein
MYSVTQFLRFSDGTVVSEKNIAIGTYLKHVKQVTIHFFIPHCNNVNSHILGSYFITLPL